MAKELLSIPEEHLKEVIEIIESGIKARKKISKEVKDNLEFWCHYEREYLKRLTND